MAASSAVAPGNVSSPHPPISAALQRHRDLVARSLDFATESLSLIERSELVELALQFDQEALSIEARAQARRHFP
jgi:hypothetical protein